MHHVTRHFIRHIARLAVVLVLGATTLAQGGAQQNAPTATVEALMGRALYQEEVEGRLDAAIATYRQVLATAGVRRAVAANAQFRIGVCYERLGRAEAKTAYEAVVRSYADQADVVKLAQARLTALASPSATAGGTVPVMRKVASGEGFYEISQDGRLSVIEDRDYITIRDLAGGEVRQMDYGDCASNVVKWSSDSRTVLMTCDPRDSKTRAEQLRMRGLSDTTWKVLLSSETFIQNFAPFPSGQGVLVFTNAADRKSMDLLSIDFRSATVRTIRTVPAIGVWGPQVSPNGQFVAFQASSRESGRRDNDVYVMPIADGETRAVLATTDNEELAGWTPTGDGLVVFSDRGGSRGLWVVPMRNGQVAADARRVPVDASDLYMPAVITRDGVLLAGKKTSLRRLFMATVDLTGSRLSGAPQELLTTYREDLDQPQWSPDGKTVAFLPSAGQSPRIGLLAVDSNKSTERVTEASPTAGLRWSADSLYVYYNGRLTNLDSHVYRLDVRTGQTTSVPGTSGIARDAIISQDWRRVFFAVSGKGIVMRDLETGLERTVYEATVAALSLSFDLSPDERWVAVHETRRVAGSAGVPATSATTISVISLDGGAGPRELFRSGADTLKTYPSTGVRWSRDGRAVHCIMFKPLGEYIYQNFSLVTLPIDGSKPTYIDFSPAIANAFSVHSDGTRVVFSSLVRGPEEIWAIENFLQPPGAKAPVR